MNLKFTLFCLVLSFLLLPIVSNDTPPAEKETPSEDKKTETDADKEESKDEKKDDKPKGPKLACNKDLVTTLGMKGLDKPEELDLEMCPSITHSCCEIKDQLIMYDNWNTIEKPKLESNLKAHYDIYATLLLELIEVESGAKSLISKDEREPNISRANCKVMAQRLVELNLKEQSDKIKAQIKLFHDFVLTLHKGFHCSVCDANIQKFIDVNKKELILSKSTCREIVSKSFVFMIYFHVHLLNVLNLSATYISSCDTDGTFTEKAIPPEHKFIADGSTGQLMFDVRDNRNSSNWFIFFKNYCEKTSVTQFTEFLMPNLKKIEEFTKFIRTSAKAVQSDKNTTDLADKVAHDPNASTAAKVLARLLDDSKKEDKTDESKENKAEAEKIEKVEKEIEKVTEDKEKIVKEIKVSIYEPFKIYNTSLNAVVPITEFKTVFSDPGIDLYDIGVCASFDEPLYQKIKSMKGGKEAGKASSSGLDSDKSSGKSAFIMTTIFTVGLTFLFIM